MTETETKADKLREVLYSHDPFTVGPREEYPQAESPINHVGKKALEVREEIGWDEFVNSLPDSSLRPTLLAVEEEDITIDDHLSGYPEMDVWDNGKEDLANIVRSLQNVSKKELSYAPPAEPQIYRLELVGIVSK